MSRGETMRLREQIMKREMRKDVPDLSTLIWRLKRKDLLPAIFFLFSRAGCDEAARTAQQLLLRSNVQTDTTTTVPERKDAGDEKVRGRGRGRGRGNVASGARRPRTDVSRVERPRPRFYHCVIRPASQYRRNFGRE
mmetsp:Transcript_64640/g.76532  ORF Transcript_64640/g.76532 Transcript_64640/m.76532 type:complete len:137 (+) Transcript_64640:175-585(+)